MPEVQPFGVKFQEAIDHLKGKLPEASLAWDSLAGPVHSKVFTVAGSTSASLSADIQSALVAALENGTTITQFRKDFDQVVAKHGWSYNGKRGWRTQVIFDNNMRSATMAGRWKQLQAGKARRPFLQYRTAGDARVRPQHRMWNGIIRHIDDPFWQTHYPPNGWGCRCTVRAYAQWEIDEDNLQVETTAYPMEMRTVPGLDGYPTDKVPVGIDPGWDHNVGISWIAPELALGRKLATLPKAIRLQMVDKTISPAFQQVMSNNWKAFRSTLKAASKPMPKADLQVLAFLDSAVINALQAQVPEIALQSNAVVAVDADVWHLEGAHKRAPAAGEPKTRSKRGGLQVWPADWVDQLPQNLRNYQAVLWDSANSSLIVVPQGKFNATVPRVAIRLNQKTKYGFAAQVVSLGSASSANLKAKNYIVLVGKVPE